MDFIIRMRVDDKNLPEMGDDPADFMFHALVDVDVGEAEQGITYTSVEVEEPMDLEDWSLVNHVYKVIAKHPLVRRVLSPKEARRLATDIVRATSKEER